MTFQFQLDGNFIDNKIRASRTRTTKIEQTIKRDSAFEWTNFFFNDSSFGRDIQQDDGFYLFCGLKEQYSTQWHCVILQWHKPHDKHTHTHTFWILTTRNLGFRITYIWEMRDESAGRLSARSSVEWPQTINLCKFASSVTLFLRWPAYLLKLMTQFEIFGQSAAFVSPRTCTQLKWEFMFDTSSTARIGCVKCMLCLCGSPHSPEANTRAHTAQDLITAGARVHFANANLQRMHFTCSRLLFFFFFFFVLVNVVRWNAIYISSEIHRLILMTVLTDWKLSHIN